jgi:hypothetical protein
MLAKSRAWPIRTKKVEFPIMCGRCRHTRNILFSELMGRRHFPCPCGVNIRIDRHTLSIVAKSVAAVHTTFDKLLPFNDTITKATDLEMAGPIERTRVNLEEARELRYWCKHFEVTQEKLRAAERAVGPFLEDIERHLALAK